MKTRDKSRNEQPQILSIRVNSNDPHDEIMQTKKDKNPKRYRTVRVEDIDGQDKASACPSIEKELPELSIHANKKGQFEGVTVINDLVKCNELKEAALNKATAMIKLLSEENSQLNAKIEELEAILRQKERTIELFEEQVRANSSHDRILGKDIMSDREKDTLRVGQKNPLSYTPREGRIKSKSELFFEFTHSKDRNLGNRKSQNKIVSVQQPTFKDIADINISKKLSPFTSKNITKNYLQTEEERTNKAIEELTLAVMKEEIYNGKFLFEELTELVSVEEDEYEQFMVELGRLENWASNEELDGTMSQSASLPKKLFSDGMMEDVDSPSVRELLQGYQKIIQEYKEYAAYLKSYLCECLNFLAGLPIATLNSSRGGEVTLVPLLKLIARDIAGRVGGKFYALREENSELKVIMEELIKNIEMARKREEPSVHPWSDFGLSIKQFQ